jgi:hypothetical protein
MNLVISPEIPSFCRRKIEEWDPREEPDPCIRAVQELTDQWAHTWNERDPVQTEQEDDAEGQILSRKLGWCPMRNQWVA